MQCSVWAPLLFVFLASVLRLVFVCAYNVAATSLHKPIMVSVRHAMATNDDAIIHIAAMPSVSQLGVLLQYFFILFFVFVLVFTFFSEHC